MNVLTSLLLELAFAAICDGRTFVFENNRLETVWVGALGYQDHNSPKGGGWKMEPGSKVNISVDDSWAGRFWGRTGCSFDTSGRGSCQTGDCGGVLQCNKIGGVSPVTIAEVSLEGYDGLDFYDISLADGFNLPVTIQPFGVPNKGKVCGAASCPTDVNASCPAELQHKANDSVVGCKSACSAFNTDQYCCRRKFATKCIPSDWPVRYDSFFKSLCPGAFSYAWDSVGTTYSCADTDYLITFS